MGDTHLQTGSREAYIYLRVYIQGVPTRISLIVYIQECTYQGVPLMVYMQGVPTRVYLSVYNSGV